MALRGYSYAASYVSAGVVQYEAFGPLVGPATLESVTVGLTSAANFVGGWGLSLGLDSEPGIFAYRAGQRLLSQAQGGFMQEQSSQIEQRFSTIPMLVTMRFVWGVSLSSVAHWLHLVTTADAAGRRYGVLLNVVLAVRTGFGRRSGDVPVEVAPAGAGVLSSLQGEARRAAGHA